MTMHNGSRRADLLSFVESRIFADCWRELRLTDDDLLALQTAILSRPKGCPLIRGTGGLRKMRFAPLGWRKGKSGAIRVGYAYLEEYGRVFLMIAYTKNEKDDLTPKEKKTICQVLVGIKQELAKGLIR